MKTNRLTGWLLFGVLAMAGCPSSTPPGGCKTTADCAAGTGVCRDSKCAPAPCVMGNCMAGESCDPSGMCKPVGGGDMAMQAGSDAGGGTDGGGGGCMTNKECVGKGVCRAMKCADVPCGPLVACFGDELCVGGKCAPAAKPGNSRTFAAGGTVSTNGKHIHIGITGQGRAIGPGDNGKHSHNAGAPAVLGR